MNERRPVVRPTSGPVSLAGGLLREDSNALGGPVKMQLVRAATGNPNHGIGVQPDNKAVWVSDRLYNVVHAYSLPDLKYLGAVPVAVDPFWMTFTPDSKFVYVANDASASVSAIDTESMKEVARIPVGQVPKRNTTAMLP